MIVQPPRRSWAIAAFLWTVLIILLCWTPRSQLPRNEDRPFLSIHIPHLDKIVHGALFVGFSAFWRQAGASPRRILAAAAVLALGTELGQMTDFVNRDANVPDFLADMAGALAGLLPDFLRRRGAPRDVAAAAVTGTQPST